MSVSLFGEHSGKQVWYQRLNFNVLRVERRDMFTETITSDSIVRVLNSNRKCYHRTVQEEIEKILKLAGSQAGILYHLKCYSLINGSNSRKLWIFPNFAQLCSLTHLVSSNMDYLRGSIVWKLYSLLNIRQFRWNISTRV